MASALLSCLQDAAGRTHPAPVFIGGASRSGTTLLGTMLGSSCDAVAVPEARFKWTLLASMKDGSDSVVLPSAIRQLSADWKFGQWRIALPAASETAGEEARYGDLLRCLARQYAERVGKPDARAWVDHTPGNVKYMARLGRVLPDARFVHLIRDGRAVASSLLPLDWGPNDVFEAAHLWMAKVGMGLAACSALGDRAMSVRYEDLVYEPHATLKQLCGFLGLTYDDGMVARRDFELPGYTAEQHALVTGLPDPSRAERWRTLLSSKQVEAFEYLTGDMLAYLGYDLENGMSPRKPSAGWHVVQSGRGAVRKRIVNPVRRHLRRRAANNR